jgi:hypothetical protein
LITSATSIGTDDIPSAASTNVDNKTVTPAHNTDLQRALCRNVDNTIAVISVHTSGVHTAVPEHVDDEINSISSSFLFFTSTAQTSGLIVGGTFIRRSHEDYTKITRRLHVDHT